jgi:uncharacterized membrane protein (UPF0182 family)
VRNSVKAVVNAYDGSVTFYVQDADDPIIKAWESAFGNLFTPGDQMPPELREHLRYPEDLFRVQTDIYSKYQLDSQQFFEREGAWSVAQAPSIDPRESTAAASPSVTAPTDQQAPSDLASESSTARFTPYYTLFGDPSGTGEDFVILRPFVPFSTSDQRTELQAYMTASSDPDDYGALTAYVVKPLVDGPRTVSNQIDSSPTITQQITLQTGGGNSVTFGDLQLVPVADGLLWVRPFYASVRSSSDRTSAAVTEYRFVIVYYNGKAEWGESLADALAKVFPGYTGDLGDRIGPDEDSTPPPEDGEPQTAGTPAELLQQADQLLQDAQQGLTENGDLGEYQDKVDQAKALVQQALDGLVPPTTTTAPPTTGG